MALSIEHHAIECFRIRIPCFSIVMSAMHMHLESRDQVVRTTLPLLSAFAIQRVLFDQAFRAFALFSPCSL